MKQRIHLSMIIILVLILGYLFILSEPKVVSAEELVTEAWDALYDGTASGSDRISDMAVDDVGNVYVTGWSLGSGTDYDCTTIKYDSDGNEEWVERYNGPASGYDEGRAIAVDNDGNIFVTGLSDGGDTGLDIITIKYDTDGTELWVERYDGPAHDRDEGRTIAVDNQGNVYVAGARDINPDGFQSGSPIYFEPWHMSVSNVADYVTIKYDSSGEQQWVASYDGTAGLRDYIEHMCLDSSGNVYVTGLSSFSMLV